jgi:hypothetical protein
MERIMDRKSDPLISYVKVTMSEYNELWNRTVPKRFLVIRQEKRNYNVY